MIAEAVAIICPVPGKRNFFVAIWSRKYRCFCLPGGSIDPGETIEDAAVRELREETGLRAISEPVILGIEKAVKKNCAAVYIEAAGTLRGSEEGEAGYVHKDRLLIGPYANWTRWALGL